MTAIPIFAGQDFYVPELEVNVGGRPLERAAIHDVTTVTYHDSLDEIDGFEITINNWDAEQRTFKYADSRLFDPGRKLELWLGYHGRDRLKLMVTGQITSLKPTFPASGQPTLVVSGLNLLHSLRREQVSAAYENKTDSEIARQIVTRLGDQGVALTLQTPAAATENRYPYLFQDNRYDIVFLLERARRIGYDLFVVEPVGAGDPALFFGPSPRVRRVTYDLTYGRSLIDFNPTFSTALQVGKVTVRGWNAVTKEAISETVDRSQLATTHVARGEDDDPAGAFRNREEVITDRPVATKEEARTLARETLERIAKETVTASGSVVGLPDLRAGTVVRIAGVGARFGGRYFVTATSHTISDSGYTTQFDCRREELT
jgi:Bacteriophage probable baseplate hub protein